MSHCPLQSRYVSSFYYICVPTLLYMCKQRACIRQVEVHPEIHRRYTGDTTEIQRRYTYTANHPGCTPTVYSQQTCLLYLRIYKASWLPPHSASKPLLRLSSGSIKTLKVVVMCVLMCVLECGGEYLFRL